MFLVDVQEKSRRICNIELHYAAVTLNEGTVFLCICDDARFFSLDILRQLLLADYGSQPLCAVALSLCNGELIIRAVSLK